MATTVGGIRVRILGDDSDLQKTLGDSTKQLAKYGAAAAAAGAAAATALTVQGLRSVDAQAKLARSLDTSIDSLRALKIAASDSGLDGLEASMKRLNRRLGAAEMGMGEAGKSVEALNLNLAELSEMDADERIATIADAVRDSGVSMQQAARHAQNLGFEQAEAAAFFKQGGDAIRSYRQEVKDLGLSLSDLDAAKVEAANDAFARFGLAVESIEQQLAVQLAPTIEAVSKQLIEDFSKGSDSIASGIETAVDSGVDALADFMEAAGDVTDIIQDNPVSAQFGLLGWVLMGPKGALIGAAIGATFDMIQEGLARFGVGISQNEDKARKLIGVQEDIARAQQIINVAKEKGLPLDSAQVQGAREEIAALKEIEAGLADAVGQSSEAQDAYNEILNTGTIKADGLAGSLRRVAKTLRESREEAEAAASSAAGGMGVSGGKGKNTPGKPVSNVTDEERSAIEARLETIREANLSEIDLLKEKQAAELEAIEEARIAKLELGMSYDELEKQSMARHEEELTAIHAANEEKRKQQTEKAERAKDQIRESMVSNASALLSALGKDNKAFAVASIALTKGLAIAQTLAHTQTAAMLAYSSQLIPGDPTSVARATAAYSKTQTMGNISAGLIAATGLVEASQALGGGGGSGGGGGGASAVGGGAMGGGQSTQAAVPRQETVANIRLEGDMFSRDSVKGLMEQMNELSDDGMRLRVM